VFRRHRGKDASFAGHPAHPHQGFKALVWYDKRMAEDVFRGLSLVWHDDRMAKDVSHDPNKLVFLKISLGSADIRASPESIAA